MYGRQASFPVVFSAILPVVTRDLGLTTGFSRGFYGPNLPRQSAGIGWEAGSPQPPSHTSLLSGPYSAVHDKNWSRSAVSGTDSIPKQSTRALGMAAFSCEAPDLHQGPRSFAADDHAHCA